MSLQGELNETIKNDRVLRSGQSGETTSSLQVLQEGGSKKGGKGGAGKAKSQKSFDATGEVKVPTAALLGVGETLPAVIINKPDGQILGNGGDNVSTSSSTRKRRQLELRQLEEQEALRIEELKLRLKFEELEGKKKLTRLRLENELKRLEEGSGSEEEDQEDPIRPPQGNLQHNESVREWVSNTQVNHNQNFHIHQNQRENFENDQRREREPSTNEILMRVAEALSLQANTAQRANNYRNIRELPIFDGSPEDWPRFNSDFQNSTATTGVGDAENLGRLQRALKGRALDSVRALLVHPHNVPRIIEQLSMRFGRPELVIEAQIEKVRNLKKIKDENLEQVVEFSSVVENLVTTIESFKKMGYLMDSRLQKELEQKLPPLVLSNWALHSVDYDETNLRLFSNWLQKQARGYSKFLSHEKPPENSKKVSKCENIEKNEKVEKNEIVEKSEKSEKNPKNVSQAQRVERNEKRPCAHCGLTNHHLYACKKFEKLNVQERWDWVKSKRLCFNCLREGHRVGDCRAKPCPTDNCTKKHNRLLHETRKYENNSNSENVSKIEKISIVKNQGKVLMKILPVILSGPTGEVETLAFFDEGSSITLIQENMASRLGLQGEKKKIHLSAFNGEESSIISHKVRVGIRGKNKEKEYVLRNVLTHPSLQCPKQGVEVSELEKIYDLPNVKIESYPYGEPTILIGMDNAFLLSEKKESSDEGPTVSWSKLGHIVHGPTSGEGRESAMKVASVVASEELHNLVKTYFSTEEFGVRPSKSIQSKENLRALQIMESTTQRVEGGWETGLLWREENPHLPKSREGALQRWKSMESKMKKNSQFEKKYEEKINEYKIKGFVRRVGKLEKSTPGKIWYLPHFHALNPKKPDKIRLVFDAAAVINGTSLNDNLLQGPDLYTSLPKILLKFRQYRVAFSGDIKDMFHRVKIIETDLQAQRFLYRDENDPEQVAEYLMTVMIFGAKCSPASAQFVKNKNAKEFQNTYPEAVRAIIECHYVDDYLDSCEDVQSAQNRINEVSLIHSKGGFTICNWLCNIPEVLQNLPEELLSKKSENKIKEESERVLGLYWKSSEDIFTYPEKFITLDEAIIMGTKTPTKREVLRVLMTIFDPLGFVAHFTVGAKIILQEIWRSGVDWGQEIHGAQMQKWKKWVNFLPKLRNLNLPRCYEPEVKEAESVQLHVFVDASQVAFCAVGYLRFKFSGRVGTALVMGKTRVAPLKTLSIPRLELQAAVMGCRLAQTVSEALEIKIEATHYWSDSMTVLKWLRADPARFKTFVAVRIGEIVEASDERQWHWVPTKLNVADEATRGTWEFEFDRGARWYTGPEFLKEEESAWPQYSLVDEQVPESELIANCSLKNNVQSTISEVVPENDELIAKCSFKNNVQIIEFKRFSKFSKLVKCIVYVRRFLSKKPVRESGEVKLSELEAAERVLWRLVQLESFPEELQCCELGRPISSQSSIYQLSPHMLKEENILRMRGRLAKVNYLPTDVKFPIIVDPAHYVTQLLIMHYHESCKHQGLETVLVELRQRYWVLRGRMSVRKVSNQCRYCQLMKPRPVEQEMGELPSCRTEKPMRAFTYTGLDYFGPLEVVIGRRREKRWVALFTCLSVRAVHLELVSSLTTDSTIMALRRFCARRGNPSIIYSDNGTNFVGAEAELKKSISELNNTKISNELTSQGVEWKFIPPGAPHMGGAWERLVKSVKVAMGASLQNKAFNEETLLTMLIEAERIVNSRPITYLSENESDPECLTPNHFLIGPKCENPPVGEFEERDLLLKKKWRASQRLAENFWNRWVREYLPSLNKRSKWHEQGHELKVGELVFLVDESQMKGNWVKGIVEEVFPGADGRVRVANVRTEKGTYKRAITKLLVPASSEKDI